MDWFLLPPATETMAQDVALCAKGRFIGDPSHVYEHVLTLTEGQLDEVVVSYRCDIRCQKTRVWSDLTLRRELIRRYLEKIVYYNQH